MLLKTAKPNAKIHISMLSVPVLSGLRVTRTAWHHCNITKKQMVNENLNIKK